MRRTAAVFVLLCFVACRGSRSDGGALVDSAGFASLTPSTPVDSTLRIIISDQPQVYANGSLVSLARLDSMLATLKAIDGVVWYYRQPIDLHLAAQQDSLVDSVLSAVHRLGLELWPSRTADFGDLAGKRRRPSETEAP